MRAGVGVRALVRDATSPSARALSARGAAVAQGSFEDTDSLAMAVRGADAVFSVQLFNPRQPERELAQARALISASREAGVTCFVQSSVSAVGLYQASPNDDRLWDKPYWQSKSDVEGAARSAGFASVTILRPAFMMENFAPPKAAHMFPDLAQGRLRSALLSDKPVALIAADDIGTAATRATLEPAALAIHELAGDLLTPPEMASALSAAWNRPLVAETASGEDLRAGGLSGGWIQMQHWMNSIGYPARPSDLERIGMAPTRLLAWAKTRKPA